MVGTVVLPEGLTWGQFNKRDGFYSTSHLRRDIPWPSDKEPRGDGESPQDREDALRAWRNTPESIKAHKEEYRCNLEFQADGAFRFDDVPPGKYALSLSFYRITAGPNEEFGTQKLDVVVAADAPAVPTDEPLDLGELRIENASEGQ